MKQYFVKIPTTDTLPDHILFSVNTQSALFIVEGRFDNDDVSDTYKHWILTINRLIPNEERTEERTIVVNRNCIYFQYDEIYTVMTASALEEITQDNLGEVALVFNMRQEDE